MPSSSWIAEVFALMIASSVICPDITKVPVGVSLIFRTFVVPLLATCSNVPWPSVKRATTRMEWPTRSSPRLNEVEVAPLTSLQDPAVLSACHCNETDPKPSASARVDLSAVRV